MAVRGLKNLCTPSKLYLVISMVGLIVMAFQNFGNKDKLCVGYLSCDVTSTTLLFAINILYVLLWTWILNLICDAGASPLSWFLVLFPIILSFVIIGYMMI